MYYNKKQPAEKKVSMIKQHWKKKGVLLAYDLQAAFS
jgi:hypothetical protein